jgi:hypothetical protein
MDKQKQKVGIAGGKILLSLGVMILLQSCNFQMGEKSTPDTPIKDPPTSTVEQPSPITPSPTFIPPTGFIEYQDIERRISIYIPENWIVTGVVTGEYVIFQSYSPDKYVGGEGFQPGDTKCDLSMRLDAATPEDLLLQLSSDSMTTIVSQEEVILASGLPALRVELDSRGLSLSMFTDVKGKVIGLTCFGDYEFFDLIAGTIRALEE